MTVGAILIICFVLSLVILILVCFKYKAGQGPESRPCHPNANDLEAGSPPRDKDGKIIEESAGSYIVSGKKRIPWPKPDDTQNYRVNDEVHAFHVVGTMEELHPDFITAVMVVPKQTQLIHACGNNG